MKSSTEANKSKRIAKDDRLKAHAVAKWARRKAKGKPMRGHARAQIPEVRIARREQGQERAQHERKPTEATGV